MTTEKKDKKERGFLTKAFIGAAKVATIGLAVAVAWQVFLDPIFFPIFHDASNTTAQALISLIHTNFAWIPDMIGLTGGGGFLNTDMMQAVLSPYYTPPAEALIHNLGGIQTAGNYATSSIIAPGAWSIFPLEQTLPMESLSTESPANFSQGADFSLDDL